MSELSFKVVGLPKPAGSKRPFMIRKGGVFTGKVAVVDACKGSRPWKSAVSHEAAAAMEGRELMDGPLTFHVLFNIPRPKYHYRTGKNAGKLKEDAPHWPTSKPDLLKLARAIEDALNKIVYHDDSQIVIEHLEKVYATTPGCSIVVTKAATLSEMMGGSQQ